VRLDRYNWLIGGLLALAVAAVVVTMRSPETAAPTAEHPEYTPEVRTDFSEPAGEKAGRTQDLVRVKADLKREKAAKGSKAPGREKAPASPTEAKTPREQAVEAWERQIDDAIARTNMPVKDLAGQVREAFHKLDKADRLDGIRRGLNLLPDEQFAALYGILYDKAEDAAVLEAIFSDALNRPEAIKNPIMKDLRKDPAHPMFFESARILDIVESKEEKAPQK
jgi:hypothetical protein